MRIFTKCLCFIFLSVLIYLIFSIWAEADIEVDCPRAIPGEELSVDLRNGALRPLKVLDGYYQMRDPKLVEACIDETIVSDEILILGTNPGEIFQGRDGARNLLLGDWNYWGHFYLDWERASLSSVGDAIYFAVNSKVNLDIYHFMIPVRVTGVLVERDGQWYISKMQFINNLNTNYLVFSMVAVVLLILSILLYGGVYLFSKRPAKK